MPMVHTGQLEPSEIGGDISNTLLGVASGYKIARGEITVAAGAAEKDVTTGLATVLSACAVLEDNPGVGVGDAAVVTAEISGTAGHVIFKSWQDDFVTAATTNWKRITWIAVGT